MPTETDSRIARLEEENKRLRRAVDELSIITTVRLTIHGRAATDCSSMA